MTLWRLPKKVEVGKQYKITVFERDRNRYIDRFFEVLEVKENPTDDRTPGAVIIRLREVGKSIRTQP